MDLLTKAALRFCVGHTLAPLGVDLPAIVAEVPTERWIVRQRLLDFGFRLADGSQVGIEEVSGRHTADLHHVLVGAALLAEECRRPVHVVIIYTDQMGPLPEALDAGALGLRVRNVYGPRLDGDAVLDGLTAKVERGEGLSGEDAMALALLGVMRHRRRRLVEALGQGLALAATLRGAAERAGCAAALVLLGQRRLEAAEVAELVGVFRMAAPDLAHVLERIGREKGRVEGWAEGRAEGWAKGRAEGKAEGVLRVLARRCGEPGAELAARVRAERSGAVLDRWLDLAASCPSLEAFVQEAFRVEAGDGR